MTLMVSITMFEGLKTCQVNVLGTAGLLSAQGCPQLPRPHRPVTFSAPAHLSRFFSLPLPAGDTHLATKVYGAPLLWQTLCWERPRMTHCNPTTITEWRF